MKLETPKNPNYCATVFKIKAINKLEGCDNVVGTPILGFQAIVSNNTKVGDIGIAFTVETQLSEEFCKQNNLYRHTELNSDPESRGYLEDNRRIRAVKFRGHRSDCLFMSLDSLSFTGVDLSDLKEGDEFDVLNDIEICRKFTIAHRVNTNQQPQEKKFSRVEEKFMPQHLDSDNYFKLVDTISPDSTVIVTQKLHGTSIRIGHTIVKRKLNLRDRFAKLIGAAVQETEYDYIFGSRKVIKDPNNPDQQHYYAVDIWTQEGKKLEGLLPHNFIVYGELIGWTPENAALQKDYTYTIDPGMCKLYVYRVAFVNAQGRLIDLSWHHLKQFCEEVGLSYVPELFIGKLKDINIQDYMDKRFKDMGYDNALPLGDNDLVDEGVCIRIDMMIPQILKAKAPQFLQHETKLLDKGEEDLESQETNV